MKILAISSIILASLLTLFLIYGLGLSDQTEIVEIAQIDAPLAVVWNTITKFDEHSKWQNSIKTLYNFNNSARQVHYNFDEKTILINQQVRVRENARAIDFFQIGSEQFTSLGSFSGQLVLSPLADGSTEIRWKIMYTVKSISQRIVSNLLLENQFKNLISSNLRALKNYIEE